MNKLEILNKFTALHIDPRVYIKKPFNWNGYSVATNGHIVIFIKGESEEFYEHPESLNAFLQKTLKDCESSNEKNIIFNKSDIKTFPEISRCPDCNGVGNFGDDDFCEFCDGDGEVWTKPIHSDHEDYTFNNNYISLLLSIGAKIQHTKDGKCGFHVFNGDGFFGVIAGCKNDKRGV